MSKEKIVAIILARGGSKGLINKNILPLAGKPLIAYSIEAAQESKYIDRVIVSTDSERIKNIALNYGAEVPFIRPKHLSDDNATSESALNHCVLWLEEHEKYFSDIVVYLQITDIFRKKYMIDECIKSLLDNKDIDSSFMGLIKHKNYWRQKNGEYYRLADDIQYGIPRQVREPLFREDTGLALATRVNVIKEGKRIGERCHIIPYEQEVSFIDIHNEFDLWLSEKIINDREIFPNEE